jgi:NitT/TauT family transport system substrate-binding protein
MFLRTNGARTVPALAVFATIAAVGLSACGSSSDSGTGTATSGAPAAAKGATKVTEAGFKVMSMAPIYLAQDKGFFAKNGLDFTFTEISSGKLGVAALLSGNAQFVDLGVDDVINLHNQGKDIKFFYNLERPLTMDFVMRKQAMEKQGITTSSSIDDKFRALKGLTIGITAPGAPTDLYPRYFMKQVGLDPDKDANFVPIGDAATLVGALKAGKIDGFMLSPPNPYVAQQEGIGSVIIKGRDSLPVFKTYDFTSVAIKSDWATSHPDLVKDYSNAVSQATTWMLANPDAALKLLQDNHFSDTDPATLKLSFDLFRQSVNPTGEMSPEAVTNQINVLSSLGALKDAKGIPMSDLMTTQYNAAAS